LIDLSDSTSDIAQFDPIMNSCSSSSSSGFKNNKINSNGNRRDIASSARDPFSGSELLSDVINELNKSSLIASDRKQWTKFD
jgi:hypothetical protein